MASFRVETRELRFWVLMKVYLKLFMKVFVEMVSLKVVGDVDVILDIEEEFVEVGDICNEFSEE